jgi:hypothetical protein
MPCSARGCAHAMIMARTTGVPGAVPSLGCTASLMQGLATSSGSSGATAPDIVIDDVDTVAGPADSVECTSAQECSEHAHCKLSELLSNLASGLNACAKDSYKPTCATLHDCPHTFKVTQVAFCQACAKPPANASRRKGKRCPAGFKAAACHR